MISTMKCINETDCIIDPYVSPKMALYTMFFVRARPLVMRSGVVYTKRSLLCRTRESPTYSIPCVKTGLTK